MILVKMKSTKLLTYLFELTYLIISVRLVNSEEIIGYTNLFLNGNISVCGREECNLGNLITDAFVHSRVNNFTQLPQIKFEQENKYIMRSINETNIGQLPQERNVIGLIYAKSIANSIGNQTNINQKFPITQSDVQNVFSNKSRPIDMVIMSGRRLRFFMESKLEKFNLKNVQPFDDFLQVSGIKVKYDANNHMKIRQILIKCQKCDNDVYTEMNENDFFDVMMPSHVSQSYYSDDVVFDSTRQSFLYAMGFNLNPTELVEKYLNSSASPITTKVEGRIIINASINLNNDRFSLISSILILLIRKYIL